MTVLEILVLIFFCMAARRSFKFLIGNGRSERCVNLRNEWFIALANPPEGMSVCGNPDVHKS